MKTFNLILVVCLVILLAGCFSKQPREPQSSKIHVVEKKVMVGCPIPEYTCDFKGDTVNKLIECISKQKEIINNCRSFNKELENKNNTTGS